MIFVPVEFEGKIKDGWLTTGEAGIERTTGKTIKDMRLIQADKCLNRIFSIAVSAPNTIASQTRRRITLQLGTVQRASICHIRSALSSPGRRHKGTGLP